MQLGKDEFKRFLVANWWQFAKGSTSTYPTNLSRLVVLQKREVRKVNKSDFLAHTSPIFKVVRNSFPFSITTELYERLTHL